MASYCQFSWGLRTLVFLFHSYLFQSYSFPSYSESYHCVSA
uniref:Uncharacterized protein n=1 Tax=Anguilla anguilla TaxID=7936 RepID=A0A0E9WEK9_ANGAN